MNIVEKLLTSKEDLMAKIAELEAENEQLKEENETLKAEAERNWQEGMKKIAKLQAMYNQMVIRCTLQNNGLDQLSED